MLELKHAPRLCPFSFIVSSSNQLARHALEKKFLPGLWISGEPFSGKTHLCSIFQSLNPCIVFDNPLSQNDLDRVLQNPMACVLDNFIVEENNESVLFALFNFLKEHNKMLIVASCHHPQEKPWKLKDTKTRFSTLMHFPIHAPDEELMASILLKRLSDLETTIEPGAVAYLTRRIDRSYTELNKWTILLHEKALKHQKSINLSFVKELLWAQDV